jgi:hypothetical protein
LGQGEWERIEGEYHGKRKEFNALLREMYEMEEGMQRMQIEKEDVDGKISATKNSKAEGVIDPKVIAMEAEK